MEDRAITKSIESILDIARWAPSGDNAQPWTFRIKNDRQAEIIGRRTNPNIYEYRGGEPTLLSVGALIENIRIAAPTFGLKMSWRYLGSADGLDHIAVNFSDANTVSIPDLFNEIKIRSVNRQRYSLRALTVEQKGQLSEALSPNLRVEWLERFSDRRRMAGLSAISTNIRLAIPEAFEVHRSIVDWENGESARAVPSRALGLDRITLKLTRWSMESWGRTKFMNALGAPGFASVQMDLLPGLCCGAYFAVSLDRSATQMNDPVTQKIEAGQAIQRFWLTATKLGLVLQPCVAVLAFWAYAEAGEEFSTLRKAVASADVLASRARMILGDIKDVIFLGRIGWPLQNSRSRSVRLPLASLMECGVK